MLMTFLVITVFLHTVDPKYVLTFYPICYLSLAKLDIYLPEHNYGENRGSTALLLCAPPFLATD